MRVMIMTGKIVKWIYFDNELIIMYFFFILTSPEPNNVILARLILLSDKTTLSLALNNTLEVKHTI